MVFFRPGDIVKFKSIGREEYDRHLAEVERGEFNLRIRPVEFSLTQFQADSKAANQHLIEVLYDH
jgi:urea carboxylase